MSEPRDPGAARIRTALVLAGGGARGAYQARVLRGLLDLGLLRGDSGVLRAFAIPAKNLYTANSVFFVDARSDVLWLAPSCGFAKIAAEVAHAIPAVVRYCAGVGAAA